MASTLCVLNPLRYRGYVYDTESELYYLQSRYYNPDLCRFINADAFTSTGQGILGCNMFAYCNNSPSNYSDESGCNPWGIIDWLDKSIIHIFVQIDCMLRYGLTDEVYVKGNLGRGYLDLFDNNTKEYYEVKSINSANSPETVKQMKKYDCATIQNSRGNRHKIDPENIGARVTPGQNENISGGFDYGNYSVSYYWYKPGLIVYDITPKKKEEKSYHPYHAVLPVVAFGPGEPAWVGPQASPLKGDCYAH